MSPIGLPLDLLLTLPLDIAVGQVVDGALTVASQGTSAKESVNKITDEFLRFGQGIAAGIAALAILAGFIMIATSHGSNARAENGRQAIIAGLTGLVGVALVQGLVQIVKSTFPGIFG